MRWPTHFDFKAFFVAFQNSNLYYSIELQDELEQFSYAMRSRF
jgi:hypothetical protein